MLCIFYIERTYFRIMCCVLLQIAKKTLTKVKKGSILIKLTHEGAVRTKKREEKARGIKANTWTVAVMLKATRNLVRNSKENFLKKFQKST